MGTITPRVELADLNGRRVLNTRRYYGLRYRCARSAAQRIGPSGSSNHILFAFRLQGTPAGLGPKLRTASGATRKMPRPIGTAPALRIRAARER